MRTKIVYVLISDENDYFTEMVLLSVYSLRLYHPDNLVELATDQNTLSYLKNQSSPLLEQAHAIVVETPSKYNKFQRSRYIKTNLRRHIDGRFLYLDCDTLVCGKLDEIDHVEDDVAFSYHNDGALLRKKDSMTSVGFQKPKGKHKINFNGGVFFANDTPAAYAFFDMWSLLWQKSAKYEIAPDQPALFQTIINLHYPVHELPGGGIWNCQILSGSSRPYLKKALIYHYYSNVASESRQSLWEHLRNSKSSDNVIQLVISHPRTVGYLFLFMTDSRIKCIQETGLIQMYENNPAVMKRILPLCSKLFGPIQSLIWKVSRFFVNK